MPGVIATLPKIQFSNALGLPMAGGTLSVFLAGSTTPTNTYKDLALTIANTNPIVLDSRGECVLWLDSAVVYKIVLKNAFGVPQWTDDNISGANSTFTGIFPKIVDLAASTGAGLVGSVQAGTGAVVRTVQAKQRDVINVFDFMTEAEIADIKAGTLSLDVTINYQKALNAISATGGDLIHSSGLAKITQRLDVTGNNVRLLLGQNAGISYNTPDFCAIKFTGINCSIDGGMGAGFIGPEVWDGTNVAPTYAAVWMTGNGAHVRTRLKNIRKIGIWFQDVIDGAAQGCFIEGNYPSASWTGVETVHFGILVDPSASVTAGNYRINNNTIKSCVQGVLAGNYGSGQIIQGFVATGNIFEGCWNHGIYSNFTNGAVITGNSFNRCQVPVVVSGNHNSVSGNSIYTLFNTGTDQRDVTGISVRDGSFNSITGNTIRGALVASSSVCIGIQDVGGTSQLNDNVISGNTIEVTGGSGVAIRILGSTNAVNRNIVSGNTIKCPGKQFEAAIAVYGPSTAYNGGNKIESNTIALTSESHGIYTTYQTGVDIRGNTIEYALNNASAASVFSVVLFDCSGHQVHNNITLVRPGFGTNLSISGIREVGVCTNGNTSRNINQVNTAGGATYSPILLSTNSLLLVDQSSTGAPSIAAAVGSRWTRTDGVIGTSQYIKATGVDATGWRQSHPYEGNTTIDLLSIAAGSFDTIIVTVPGVVAGDYVYSGFSGSIQGLNANTWVIGTNNVAVRLYNSTTAAIDLPSITVRCFAWSSV